MDKNSSIKEKVREEKNSGIGRSRICPTCGQEYRAHPAISRKDGKTAICPDCGIREALKAFGYNKNEVEEGITEIHRLEEGAEND